MLFRSLNFQHGKGILVDLRLIETSIPLGGNGLGAAQSVDTAAAVGGEVAGDLAAVDDRFIQGEDTTTATAVVLPEVLFVGGTSAAILLVLGSAVILGTVVSNGSVLFDGQKVLRCRRTLRMTLDIDTAAIGVGHVAGYDRRTGNGHFAVLASINAAAVLGSSDSTLGQVGQRLAARFVASDDGVTAYRSEERRVGKECRL